MKLVSYKRPHNRWTARQDIDPIFDRFFSDFPFGFGQTDSALGTFSPRLSVSESDTEYSIQVELPGLKKTEFEAFVEDGVFTVKGEKTFEKDVENKKYHLHEHQTGEFERSLRLPDDFDPDSIQATFEDGLLTVKLSRNEKLSQRKRIEL